MSEELRKVEVIVDDRELSLIVLNGLDNSYDSFVTAQTARVENISFSLLLGLLRSYDARLNHQSEFHGITTANAVQGSQNTKSATMTCQICDKKGHTALACFNRHNEQ